MAAAVPLPPVGQRRGFSRYNLVVGRSLNRGRKLGSHSGGKYKSYVQWIATMSYRLAIDRRGWLVVAMRLECRVTDYAYLYNAAPYIHSTYKPHFGAGMCNLGTGLEKSLKAEKLSSCHSPLRLDAAG